MPWFAAPGSDEGPDCGVEASLPRDAHQNALPALCRASKKSYRLSARSVSVVKPVDDGYVNGAFPLQCEIQTEASGLFKGVRELRGDFGPEDYLTGIPTLWHLHRKYYLLRFFEINPLFAKHYGCSPQRRAPALHLYRMGSTERLRYVHDVISSLTIAEVTPKVPVADMVQQHGVYHLRVDLGGARLSLLIGGLVESVGLHGIHVRRVTEEEPDVGHED